MSVLKKVLGFVFVFTLISALYSINSIYKPKSKTLPIPVISAEDTLKPRYNDFMNDTLKNPFDLNDPPAIQKNVEYDPVTGTYLITEKIGNDYFRAPTYMTLNEYLKWKETQQRQEYFQQLSGIGTGNLTPNGLIDPASYVNVKKDLVERIFGGNEITIKPQGNIHLTLGLSKQNMDNPGFERYAQRVWNPIFDEGIQMNVEGGIGDKMKLNFNYNTKASFDFDNKIKLKYDSEQFNEDAILKTIEAGNVSLPLRGNLIQGAQDLFGIKTQLQFGHLKLTAIASQQKSEQKNLQIEKGAVKQENYVYPEDYDENRHFFLSHFNRENYEKSMSQLPNIRTPFRITRLEVWVIPERNETHDLRDICALTDMGEGDLKYYTDKSTIFPPVNINPVYKMEKSNQSSPDTILPDNKVSPFYYDYIRKDSITRKKINTSANLSSIYKLQSGKDYEIFKGRKLDPAEYTYNDQLGFVSLNRPIQPEDVLGVAYEYTYNFNDGNATRADSVFRVGEFSELADTFGKVMYVKLLKSKTQKTGSPEWDLMMKNVYYIGASDIDQESFKLDIFYIDSTNNSYKRFLPEDGFRKKPLLQVFKLDTINVNGEVQPDGIFDYIPGTTIIPKLGSIVFPVLEPFGRSIDSLLHDPAKSAIYSFKDLYTKSKIKASENAKNNFVLKFEYKSSQSSEISLGTWNLQGNPIVTAGGITLQEGIDYDLDRGAGKIRIINPAILQQGRAINVRFEDNSLFNLSQKNMLGLRADYEIRKNFNIGATYLHLFERPYTQKVNYGDDPINNRIFGLDMDYSSKVDWLTRAIDKLPLISTKAPSSLSFKTELAALKPGHNSQINNGNDNGGNIILDDFEGSSVKIYLNNDTEWNLCSTPIEFEESKTNTLASGANRAMLSWYMPEAGGSRSSGDVKDPYSRIIEQKDLFSVDYATGSLHDLRTFDFNFYPSERGPYNFDIPGGYTGFTSGVTYNATTQQLTLNNPKSRWGGMARYLKYSDFEALNVEYIEFWMLNPYIKTRIRNNEVDVDGKLEINLGNISEDVLKDGLQFYENSLPLDNETVPTEKTLWGYVPKDTPLDDAFPNDKVKIAKQDLGLDGMNDATERIFHKDYLDKITLAYPNAIINDVANDNWEYFDSPALAGQHYTEKFKKYDNPESNFPDVDAEERRGRLRPDKEEMNENKSLDITEAYFKYEIPLAGLYTNGGYELDTNNIYLKQYITDVKKVNRTDTALTETWYRFRIPITSGTAVGNIEDFRSIQFMRMYVTNFETPKTFRLAEFGLVRNQWKKLGICAPSDVDPLQFDLDAVGLEENSSKIPFNYVSPPGVIRERVLSNYENIRQDEKSLALKFKHLRDSCLAFVYKQNTFDARLFKRIQLSVHAESSDFNLKDGDLHLIMRFGRDKYNNYYEYDIPLYLSKKDDNSVSNIWLDQNYLDILLKDFTDLKLERNANGFPLSEEYSKTDDNNTRNPGALLKVKGNPSLGYIKEMVVGVTTYNKSADYNGEIWINELRVNGLDEKGGVAATANLDIKLADLGSVNGAFNYKSVGFGALDQKLAQRSMDEIIDYDVSTNIQIGRLMPASWKVNLPIYLQYGQTIKNPKYDAYDLDLTVDENLNNAKTTEEKQDIKDRSRDVLTVKSMNFANVSVNKGDPKYPWSPSNIKIGYYYTDSNIKNPIIRNQDETDQKLTLDYGFNLRNNLIKPFAKTKTKSKFIKDIGFGLIPNSFSFNTQLRKYDNVRTYREPKDIDYTFEERRFNWDRNYNLQWNFTKNLKLNFNASNIAVVDQLQKWGISDEYRDVYGNVKDVSTSRQYMLDNIKAFGRPKSYLHNFDLSYALPLKNIKALSWIDVSAKYSANFTWTGSSVFQETNYGNTIQNMQSRTINGRIDFEKLYKSIKYLRIIDAGFEKSTQNKSNNRRKPLDNKSDIAKNKDDKNKKEKEKKDRKVTAFEKIILRPLLVLRDIKLTYKEDFQTTVPGYTKRPEFLGTTDFDNPGWDFVAGLQKTEDQFGPWLDELGKNDLIVKNKYFNNQFYHNNSKNYGAKITLEPINNLKFDVDFKKTFIKDNSREFKNTGEVENPKFESLTVMDRGSFEVSYSGLKTLFTKNYETLYDKFSKYRETISDRQYKQRNGTTIVIKHDINPAYALGYGPQNQDVLIPAFIAAYTGKNENNVSLDIYDDIGKLDFIPRPNWNAEWNLSKYGFLKDVFSSFKIVNGYKSVLKVSSIQSDLNYNTKRNIIETNERDYYLQYIIPSVVLDERFEPVIGLDIKTKSDLNFKIDYRKSRSMLLSQKSLQENRAEEIVLNFGYVVKNVKLGIFTKKNSKSKKSAKTNNDEDDNASKSSKKGATNSLRDLRLGVDFSIKDTETKEYLFDSGRDPKATHGNYRISLIPTAEYNISDNFSLQLDFSYDKTIPYVSNSWPTTNYRGTVTAKYSLK